MPGRDDAGTFFRRIESKYWSWVRRTRKGNLIVGGESWNAWALPVAGSKSALRFTVTRQKMHMDTTAE